MLRTFNPARSLAEADFDSAISLCSQDPMVNVFVAARLMEGGPMFATSLIGVEAHRELSSMCWVSANVVPVNATEHALDAFASKLKRHRRRSSSIFGQSEQVLGLWDRLERHWGTPRSVRTKQPMMAISQALSGSQRAVDPRVRLARADEIDLVVPASAHMFTEEIGYPPFYGSDRDYRRLVSALIQAGHTYVIVENGRVIFKADVGSLADGVAQLQGVWVAPHMRGQGLAVPAMNAVVQQTLQHLATTVTLYVNGYNERAIRTYTAVGFQTVSHFATVIL